MHHTWRLAGMLAGTVLVLTLAAPLSGFAQDPTQLAATFDERYLRETPSTEAPATQPPQQPVPQAAPASPPAAPVNPQTAPASPQAAPANPPAAPASKDLPRMAHARKEQNVAPTPRASASAKRARTHVVVEPRSFLDAGTEVLPGERKFTDYAFPPTHTPMDVVTNTGGRVGWHNSPLPGPFSPWFD